ncbi:MAG TPA: hypothetical protein EYN66_12125 [Myxococcales bacterium]|nr:hypothetical protein [Myxococcales bacterium]
MNEITIDPECLERLGVEIAYAIGESERLTVERDKLLAALSRVCKSLDRIALEISHLRKS